MLYSLLLSLPSGHFPRDFNTKILHTCLLSLILFMIPAHCSFFDFTVLTIQGNLYKSNKCNVMEWLALLLHIQEVLGSNLSLETALQANAGIVY
jgi:hypothetical protein